MSLEDDLRAYAARVVSSAAEDMVGLLRAVAPVRSGFLLSTIEDPVIEERDDEVAALVRVGADYADETDARTGWYTAVTDEWEQFLRAAEAQS